MNIINTNLDFGPMSGIGRVNGIVLHHSGVSVLQSVEVIHNYHKNHNGWAGIGYHYYVRKDGSIYRGRPEAYTGAHCPGVNSTSIGICAEGDFNAETMNDVQKQAIKELIADIKSRYNIEYIKGHREILATSCPGNNYPLNEIRNSQPAPQPTEDAYTTFVKEVQRACGAKVDGIAGPETISKTVTISIRKNSNHAVVKPVQKYLISLGYSCGSYGADGVFGVSTKNAVVSYQKNNGCVADGEITARNKTWKKLLKI